MADKITLALEQRTLTGKKVNQLRRAGVLPATVYGKGVGPFTVQLDARTFSGILRHAGRTTLLELEIPGQKPHSAFIHTLQRHPVSRAIIHADFLVVDLLTEITVEVPIHIVGESELVERGDAILNQVLNSLDIRALPADLPHAIDVDISALDTFDKSIRVRDIVVPEKWRIETDEDELVVSLNAARPEAAAAEEEVTEETAAEPELLRDKREDEE
jgi:large subunit ribosomal protein L25